MSLTLSKRTRLQRLGLIFMGLCTAWLLALAGYALNTDLNQREVGYLLGVSMILIAELIYLYISAFTNRVTWLIDTKGRKVGVIYDEIDLAREMAEIVGAENMTIPDASPEVSSPTPNPEEGN